ncbi:MAG: Threonine--tRNA ligase 2 [Chlamydiae bacterium]|nr:Threonine--tRNA ligase 2 [Chlamydiota bacterium]
MERKEELSQIRLTAAEITAAAVAEYAPKSYKISGGETPWGFYYDFVFNLPFSEEMLPLIEERMRQIASANLEIKIHEMLPKNAAEFLRHHEHPYAAHFAKHSSAPLVQIYQMGEFIDMIEGSALSTTNELRAFKLLGICERPSLTFRGDKKKVFRIYGSAFQEKSELKSFMKEKEQWLEGGHLNIGEKLALFKVQIFRSPDLVERAELFWRGEGEKLIHSLKEFWRKIHSEEGFELIETSGSDLTESHQKYYHHSPPSTLPLSIAEMRAPLPDAEMNPLEGLLSSQHIHRDTAHIFCSKKQLREKIISSLKFLEKIPTMFQLTAKSFATSSNEFRNILEEAFDGEVERGVKSEVVWQLQDGYGRFWRGPSLTVKKWGEGYLIQCTAYSSLERLIALILEKGEKDLSQKKEILSKIMTLDE